MIALHITAQLEGKEIRFTVDRLRREDANKQEAAVIDFIHDSLQAIAEMLPLCTAPIETIKDGD